VEDSIFRKIEDARSAKDALEILANTSRNIKSEECEVANPTKKF
jgi:hypothetical protein